MKEEFKKLGKSYTAAAAEIGCSKTALVNAVVHGKWPKKDADRLREKLRQYFETNGADIPAGLRNPETAPAHPNESEDNEMLLRKATLTQAAKQHFGLPRDPFNDEIREAADVFLTPDVRYVREAMFQTACHGGFVAVVGESGAGKSTLREDLQDRINREGKQIIMIEPYVLAMEDNDIKGKTLKAAHIAAAILEAVAPGVKPYRDAEARFRQVHRALQESARAGNKHVLIIEEAHGMPVPTLKHLKRFFELKNGFERLLGIVLIGQTELAQKLAENNPHVREVVQRCELVTLLPLTDGKLKGYLKHKFERAGGDIAKVMDESAIDAIADRLTVRSRTAKGAEQHSLLYPLAVNNLVSAAMNQAAELGFDIVDADVVKGV
ncbi:ABC-type transport system involved in cytochrome bd biosynthesis, fused ATPase and permease components [Neisseria zoodegmatis]|uniref:ABC-type transport system involved in cytochrome bd biosynthesis, fused ATPase and permease components n=1 Tax=Neisseria zoodegmatis TaxID=326523 RepID=A0A378WFT6_9NEIS|nr:AAA family ATPase [Neisseria zoodegmatis]SUA36328.1 ABC-type transport system involved in cytochrome bd biosynthesis, fused ATPase and permease components [Neisseria zoodegmatis]